MLDRVVVKVHAPVNKKQGQNWAILTKQARSIKDLLLGIMNAVFLCDTVDNPEQAESAFLTAWVCDPSAEFRNYLVLLHN